MKSLSLPTPKPLLCFLMATLLCLPVGAFAHCDTLGGPVIADARQALAAHDVTPVLKWVAAKDEARIKKAFHQALAAQGKAGEAEAETAFFTALVKIHRAGEGAPFTGLKSADAVEPAVAAADRSLAAGSPEEVVQLVNAAVEEGIRHRFEKVAEAYRHKDESVALGRDFVAAYVAYTHYLERLHLDATTSPGHGGEDHRHQAARDLTPPPPR